MKILSKIVYPDETVADGREATFDGASGKAEWREPTGQGSILSAKENKTPGNVAANSIGVVNVTLTGAAVGDPVAFTIPSQAGQMEVYGISHTDNVDIVFVNHSGSVKTPPSGDYAVAVFQSA